MAFLDAQTRANLAWAKGDGLLPVVIQHAQTRQVLMLGYMNEASLAATETSGLVTFFSRSRQQLWQKGESSGNVLHVVRIAADCDYDTLLVTALPVGPTCHRSTTSCFGSGAADEVTDEFFLAKKGSKLLWPPLPKMMLRCLGKSPIFFTTRLSY